MIELREPVEISVETIPDVLDHCLFALTRRSPTEQFDQLGVVSSNVIGKRFHRKRSHIHKQRQTQTPDVVEPGGQVAVSRSLDHGPVDQTVGEERSARRPVVKLLGVGKSGLDRSNPIKPVRKPCKMARRVTFDRLPRLVQLHDTIGRDFSNDVAPSTGRLHQSLTFKTLQRIPHRRAGNIELLGELIHNQSLPRIDITIEDRLDDGVIGKVGKIPTSTTHGVELHQLSVPQSETELLA